MAGKKKKIKSLINQLKENPAVTTEKKGHHVEPAVVRCPACATSLSYTPGLNAITCTSCGMLHDLGKYKSQALPEFTAIDIVSDLNVKPAAFKDELYSGKCPSCGAEIPDFYQASGNCTYCKNPFVVSYSDTVKKIVPQMVYPFVIDRAKAKKIFKKWYFFNFWRLLFFLKVKFDDNEKLAPYFIPAYLFNAETSTDYKGMKGKKTKSSVTWTRKDGHVDVIFTNYPVHSTNSMVDTYAIRYLKWRELGTPSFFASEFISGVQANSFGLSQSEVLPRAGEKILNAVEWHVNRDIGGDTQRIEWSKTQFDKVSSIPVLLPVWRARALHRGQPVWCIINGITGQIIGRGPKPSEVSSVVLAVVLFVVFMAIQCAQLIHNEVFSLAKLIAPVIACGISVAAFANACMKNESIRTVFFLGMAFPVILLMIFQGAFPAMFMWYGLSQFIFFGLMYLLFVFSSSDDFDELIFEKEDLTW